MLAPKGLESFSDVVSSGGVALSVTGLPHFSVLSHSSKADGNNRTELKSCESGAGPSHRGSAWLLCLFSRAGTLERKREAIEEKRRSGPAARWAKLWGRA